MLSKPTPLAEFSQGPPVFQGSVRVRRGNGTFVYFSTYSETMRDSGTRNADRILSKEGDRGRAESLLRRALRIDSSLPDSPDMAGLSNNLGFLYFKQ